MRPLLPLLLLLACGGEDPKNGGGAEDSSPPEVDCSTRPIEQPAPRKDVAAAWDASNGALVFFGGDQGVPINCESNTDFTDETWLFHTDCDNFEKLSVSGPSARARTAHALDATTQRLFLHGGRYREGTSGRYTNYADIWAFDLASRSWSEVGGEGPSARSNHSMVAAGGKLYVYGGNTSTDGASFNPRGDVWSFDPASSTWTELETSGDDPGRRLFHSAAASPDGQFMYVYGGGDENAFFGPFFGDLYALDLSSLEWTQLHDGRGEAPDSRISATLVPTADGLLLFGGHDDGSLGNRNDLWSFDLGTGAWTAIGLGDELNASASGFCDFPADFVTPDLDFPERRSTHAAVATEAGFLAFGGSTDCGLINDVWGWEGGAWLNRSAASAGESCQRAFADCETLCF